MLEVSHSRYLLDIAYDLCEAEGDAEGWRTTRRAMVPYFLASNLHAQNSLYAKWTMLDLVVELAASPRTRARWDNHLVVNTSGKKGGGIFFDKHCEHCVRRVKDFLHSCHGRVDDLLLEKTLSGLSLITNVCEHNRASISRETPYKERSHDFVSDRVRHIIEEEVTKFDPFNLERKEKYDFHDKPRGSPYHGLVESKLETFECRVRDVYDERY